MNQYNPKKSMNKINLEKNKHSSFNDPTNFINIKIDFFQNLKYRKNNKNSITF